MICFVHQFSSCCLLLLLQLKPPFNLSLSLPHRQALRATKAATRGRLIGHLRAVSSRSREEDPASGADDAAARPLLPHCEVPVEVSGRLWWLNVAS